MNERQLAILIDEIGHLQNELRGCHKDIFALEKENADLRNKLDLSGIVDTDNTKWKLKYEALLTDYGKLEGVYTVKTPDGAEVLVPAIPVFVTEVIPGECVRMAPIDGMFENRDSSVADTPKGEGD